MGIVNAGQLVVYDEIEPGLRKLCEDVILNRNNDHEATEKLIAFAETVKAKGKVEEKDEAWRNYFCGRTIETCTCKWYYRIY